MTVVLTSNQYGKAENRVVRIQRDSERHEIRDLNVSTSLRGDFTAAHTDGDQSDILPTDTQKNTCFALAKEHGVSSPEDYALALGRRFLEAAPKAVAARIDVVEYAWDRASVGPNGHDHTFVRRGGANRTACVTVEGRGGEQSANVVGGLEDLVLLKSTGSEFKGFLRDEYTTLQETDDRILATSLTARWRYDGVDVDWNSAHASVLQLIIEAFATTHSRALQETLFAMGQAVLDGHPEIVEISFSAPNKHHFLYDLTPFDIENNGEVFLAADRPYGLIEATIARHTSTPDRAETDEGLARFNALPEAEAIDEAHRWLSVRRWAAEVASGRPYAVRSRLRSAAAAAAETLNDAELEEALAGHPRIGERATSGHNAAASAAEQSGVAGSPTSATERLAAGNTAYEDRFNRVFIIRAAGRSADDVLAELDRRLRNDPATERSETVANLREIALLRLEGMA